MQSSIAMQSIILDKKLGTERKYTSSPVDVIEAAGKLEELTKHAGNPAFAPFPLPYSCLPHATSSRRLRRVPTTRGERSLVSDHQDPAAYSTHAGCRKGGSSRSQDILQSTRRHVLGAEEKPNEDAASASKHRELCTDFECSSFASRADFADMLCDRARRLHMKRCGRLASEIGHSWSNPCLQASVFMCTTIFGILSLLALNLFELYFTYKMALVFFFLDMLLCSVVGLDAQGANPQGAVCMQSAKEYYDTTEFSVTHCDSESHKRSGWCTRLPT